jgi:hypothetical protein
MEGELYFRCCKDLGLAREIAAAHLQRHSALWGKSFSKDSDPGTAVISPRSVYGIDDAVIRRFRSNSNRLSGQAGLRTGSREVSTDNSASSESVGD